MVDKSKASPASAILRQRYELFSDRTTFHGFRELHESKSWLAKALWVAIMVGCTAMLSFHVQNQVRLYLTGGTITKITELTEDEPYPFPPIWIAFNDWYWLDMSRIEKFELTYEELQIAKSYLEAQSYHSDLMSPTEAKKKLKQRMESLNIIGISPLLTLLSLGTLNTPLNEPQFFVHNIYESTGFALLDISSAKPLTYTKTWDATIHLDQGEFMENARKLATFFKIDQNGSTLENTIRRPYLFHFDADQEVQLEPGETYHVAVESKVYRSLRQCRTDVYQDPLYSDKICALDCDIQINQTHKAFEPCLQLDTFPELDLTQAYRNGTFELCQRGLWINGSLVMHETTTFPNLPESEHRNRESESKQCKKSCVRQCQRLLSSWSVSIRTTSNKKRRNENMTTIRVRIPDRESLIIFEEVQQYEWHDMVSDMGGLLGLWLGASMMSLFQAVHLCCCAEEKVEVGGKGRRRAPHRV